MPHRTLTGRPGAAAHLLLDAAVDIQQAPEATEAAFMARPLVQCTLPHSDPGNVPIWTRRNGNLTLVVQPDYDQVTMQPRYPFGSIPRLFLFWLVSEAKRKQSRHLRLGNSLDAFLCEVGLNPRTGGGPRGDAKRLQDQMRRLLGARLTFRSETEQHQRTHQMEVASSSELWWDVTRSAQANLWESWIVLGENFYQAITDSVIPVDLRALRALKRSPLALDLYAWLCHAAYMASRNRTARVVPWAGLHGQFGAEYTRLRVFREKATAAIRKIESVYPALRVDVTTAGLVVQPSGGTAIPARRGHQRMLSKPEAAG